MLGTTLGATNKTSQFQVMRSEFGQKNSFMLQIFLKIGLKHSHRYNFWNGISSSQHWLKVWTLLVTVDIWQSGWCSWKTLTMLTSFILSFFKYVVNVQILHVMLTCPLQGNSGRQWAWNIRYGGFLHCCIYLDSCTLKTAWTAESMINLTQIITANHLTKNSELFTKYQH